MSHVCLPTYRKDECRQKSQPGPLNPLSSGLAVARGHDAESSPAPVSLFEQRFQGLDICSLQQIRVETSRKAYFAHDFVAKCRKGDQVRSPGRRCLAKSTCQVEPGDVV